MVIPESRRNPHAGCGLMGPHNLEIRAAGFSPATFYGDGDQSMARPMHFSPGKKYIARAGTILQALDWEGKAGTVAVLEAGL